MIHVGPLSRARVRAACLALRVRTVDELERQRDDARAQVLLMQARQVQDHRDRDAARAHASHWRRDVAQLVGVQAEGTADSDLLARLCQVLADGANAQAAADDALEVCGSHELARAEAEDERARADRELREVRDVLAPDLDPGDTPLVDVARAALASARATAAAAELRWWASQRHLERETLRACAAHLDPAGATPSAAEELTPSIFRAPTDDEVAADIRAAGGLPREAYDPAMGGDIEPPPGRGGATDAPDVGHGPCHQHPGHGGLHQDHLGYSWLVVDDVVESTVHCGMLADGVECGGMDGHAGGCWPDRRSLAIRALVDGDITHGVVAAAAAQVLDDAHLLTDRGMTIDGDLLSEVIAENLPTEWNDQSCRATADRILDAAVHAGMTVVQGPDLTPRAVAEVPF